MRGDHVHEQSLSLFGVIGTGAQHLRTRSEKGCRIFSIEKANSVLQLWKPSSKDKDIVRRVWTTRPLYLLPAPAKGHSSLALSGLQTCPAGENSLR
jgi:hypothetical protein